MNAGIGGEQMLTGPLPAADSSRFVQGFALK
jgi:hypothetical protein